MASALVDEIRADALDGKHGEYDLAGFTREWTEALVRGAFAEAMPAKRGFYAHAKFVVGGGKKTRAKYDDELLKYLTSAFRDL